MTDVRPGRDSNLIPDSRLRLTIWADEPSRPVVICFRLREIPTVPGMIPELSLNPLHTPRIQPKTILAAVYIMPKQFPIDNVRHFLASVAYIAPSN